MATWKQRWADKQERFPSFVRKTREVYGKLGGWIDRYRGGMPAGVMAAIAYAESGGRFGSAGDPQLGEVGYFQITKSTPGYFGLAADVRRDPETNVFLAGLEYNADAVGFYLRYPSVIELGTEDSWKIAMLAFAIGSGGTRTLIRNARPTKRGRVFDAILAYVDRTGGIPLGSQSAGKIWFRVRYVDYKWRAGLQAVSGRAGWPQAVPPPRGVSYTLKPEVRKIMASAPSSGLIKVLIAGALAYGAYRLLED